MKSIQAQLQAIAKRANGDIEKVASASMLRLGNRIVLQSPVDTGRFKNNWMSAWQAIDRSSNRGGNTSGSDSLGQLKDKVSSVDLGKEFFFTNTVPYAMKLEYGHSAQAPDGIVRVNALHWEQIVTSEVKKRS